jgi:hypothetical protein
LQTRKSSVKRGDFGIVNIVQEATPIVPDHEPLAASATATATEQLAEQTSQMLDEIRK